MLKKAVAFIDLPLEIQSKIIGYCDTGTILESVNRVSKMLNVLSKESTSGLNIELNKTHTPKVATKILKQMSYQIVFLKLNEVSDETIQVLVNFIGSMTNIKKFVALGSAMKLPKSLLIQLFRLKNLQIVDIKCSFEYSSLLTIGECKKLKVLKINAESEAISKEEFIMFFAHLGDIQKVRLVLNLRALNFELEEFNLKENIRKSHSLDLLLFVNTLTYPLSKVIASYFPNVCNLLLFPQTIQFVNDENNLALCHLVEKCKNLKFFLDNFKVDDPVKFKRKFNEWTVCVDETEWITMMKWNETRV